LALVAVGDVRGKVAINGPVTALAIEVALLIRTIALSFEKVVAS
jgi:hypothetical protein